MRFGIGVFDTQWLAHRIKLLEATMIPSLAGQDADFHFLVQADRDLPEPFRSRLDALAAMVADHQVARLELHADRQRNLRDVVRAMVDEKKLDFVITSRVDDDDALTFGSLGAVRRRVEKSILAGYTGGAVAINHGLRYSPILNGGIWGAEDDTSVGLSLFAPAGSNETIYSFGHKDVKAYCQRKRIPFQTVPEDEAAWLYNVHKYSDSDHAFRVVSMARRAEFVFFEEERPPFPLDWEKLDNWLDDEINATSLSSAKTTSKVAFYENAIKDQRRLLAAAAGEEEKQAIRQKMSELHAQRRESGSRIVSDLRARVDVVSTEPRRRVGQTA